jgi:hypothetical protein
MLTQEKVFYGPHTFGNPAIYLRGDLDSSVLQAHENIKNTLTSAFNDTEFMNQLSQVPGFDSNLFFPVHLDFINYGNTQMVYCARPANGQLLTVLINQPKQKLGVVKSEFENLQRLAEIDPGFVIPTWAYFKSESNELYVSSYVKNARCIYHMEDYPMGWGNFNPVPVYHFERFSEETAKAVTSNMIALLVNYYDSERGRGISKTQISGDDFILSQEFQPNNPDANTVLANMKLIAARGFIETEFQKYLDLIQQEFLMGTHYNDPDVISGRFQINHKSGAALTKK